MVSEAGCRWCSPARVDVGPASYRSQDRSVLRAARTLDFRGWRARRREVVLRTVRAGGEMLVPQVRACQACVVTSRSAAARALTAMVAMIPLLLLAGCALHLDGGALGPREVASSHAVPRDTDAWVVVIFEDRPEEFDGNLMEALFETEMRADEALAEANAGWIDGNDFGAHAYELYFVGEDVNVMWAALEPVFREAPVAWTRVELRNGLDDPTPTVITAE